MQSYDQQVLPIERNDVKGSSCSIYIMYIYDFSTCLCCSCYSGDEASMILKAQ